MSMEKRGYRKARQMAKGGKVKTDKFETYYGEFKDLPKEEQDSRAAEPRKRLADANKKKDDAISSMKNPLNPIINPVPFQEYSDYLDAERDAKNAQTDVEGVEKGHVSRSYKNGTRIPGYGATISGIKKGDGTVRHDPMYDKKPKKK